jgi:hypothetical protein
MQPGKVVNPCVGEFLVGLPRGWTSSKPFSQHDRDRVAKLMGAGIPAKRLRTLDLFSGCLGLAVGLRKVCQAVAYCDIDADARSTIQARIGDGLVEPGPVFEDVRDVNPEVLPGPIDCLAAGFPCTDISGDGTLARSLQVVAHPRSRDPCQCPE